MEGWKIALSRQRWTSSLGLAALLMLVNHAVFSITSNEFNRPNSPVMWLLVFWITYSMMPRRRKSTPATQSAR